MVLALGCSLTTGRVDHPLDFLQWTLDEAQGPPVLTATAFPPTLHCVEGRSGRAQQRPRCIRQRVRCRSWVEVRGGQEEGMKVEVGNGGAVRGERAPSRPAFPVTRPPRSGFTDLFLPHRPCPVPLHGERYSFLHGQLSFGHSHLGSVGIIQALVTAAPQIWTSSLMRG